MSRKHRGDIHIKGYYQRAKVFGYLILASIIGFLIFYLFQHFTR